MPTSLDRFAARFYAEWLPKYCHPRLNRTPDGFRAETLARLEETDAYWFLRAVDGGVVTETDGFFSAPLSRAKEQLISTGAKDALPRPLTLWTEPIITIGALGRLHAQHGWPATQLGLQSRRPWAFDLVGYSPQGQTALLAGEVKKNRREVDALLALMIEFGRVPPLAEDPARPIENNAYRKVQGLRDLRPGVFWALGPNGYSHVFLVRMATGAELVELEPIDESALRCPFH